MKRSRKTEPRVIECFEVLSPSGEIEFRTESLTAVMAYLDGRNRGETAATRARMFRQRFVATGRPRAVKMPRG